MVRRISLFLAFGVFTHSVTAQLAQQGPKLVASGSPVQQGPVALSGDGNTLLILGTDPSARLWTFTRSGGVWTEVSKSGVQYTSSLAISADGTTAIVGDISDNGDVGAAYIYSRSGNNWIQQAKLVGSAPLNNSQQGSSVALSADGNTAIVGGPSDFFTQGAFWIFTRTAGIWTQQGPKMFPSDAYSSFVGASVSLSADGNTAIVGGPGDDVNEFGAVWFYTRSGGVWTQQGTKHVGTGATPFGFQGTSVAMAGDGMTAIAGGPSGNSQTGAAWIWTRSGNTWTQQGGRLVGSPASFDSHQGTSVAISSDGNTAVVGGNREHSYDGAVWLWKRSGTTWTEVQKLVGSGGVHDPNGYLGQGTFVAMSADAQTVASSAPNDNANHGAAWVFVAMPDLRVIQTAPAAVAFSNDVTYSVTLKNAGSVQATGVTLSDTIPSQGTFVSATTSQGSCSAPPVICSIGTLASGASATITIKMTAPNSPATMTNSATATANEPDVNTADNTSSLDVAVVQSVPAMSAGLLVLLLLALAAIAWRASA